MAALNSLELQDLVQQKRFGDRMVEMSEYTVLDGYEAGFVVYRGPGGEIDVSDVVFPDPEYLEAMRVVEEELDHLAPKQRLSRLLEMMEDDEGPMGGMPELNIGRLITDQSVALRADLGITQHSHPIDHLRQRNPEDYLQHSSTDAISYGAMLPHNPGLISGISATHRSFATRPKSHDNIALRLVRPASADTTQRLQTVQRGTNLTSEKIRSLGLQEATLTFNSRTGRVVSGLATLPKLWEPLH